MSLVTRLALYCSLGLVLSLVGFDLGDWNWWLCLLLYVALDHWSRHEGRLEGVAMILEMSPSRVDRIRAMMRRVEAGEDVSQEELEAVNKDNNNDNK